MSIFIQELWRAIRVLRNNPGFTAVAIITLGLGIAANTTVFGWIDTVLLQPIPGVRNAQELVSLEAVHPENGRHGSLPHPDFRDFQRHLTVASGVVAAHTAFFTIGPVEKPQRALGQVVSANFFTVLGVTPFLGRTFSPSEDLDTPGASPLVVISHRLWSSYFNADPGVVGKPAHINGRSLTVVGVAPPEFTGTLGGAALDVWVPLSMVLQMGALNTWAASDRNARFLDITVRLKPGVTIEQAQPEVKAIAAHIAASFPDTHRGVSAALVPLWQASYGLQGTLKNPLQILMGACLLVLFIACANVTNLLMARTIARQREFGIRLALGAGRWRLLRQLAMEVLLLAGVAAVGGTLLAQWLGESLAYVLPALDSSVKNAVQPLLHIKVSTNVLVFTSLIAFAAVALSTLVPAFAMSHLDVNESLKEGGRSGTPGQRSRRTRGILVVSEVALATMALIGAGVALRSFRTLAALHPGFDSRNVLVAQFYLSTNGYPLKQEKQFSRNLRLRLEASPGIESVSESDCVPLSMLGPGGERVQVEGSLPDRSGVVSVSRAIVAPGYFDLMRIPILAGRDFTQKDELKSQRVIIINETFARRYFDGLDPLGRTVRVSGVPSTIVGLVKDSKYRNPAEGPTPFFYGPFQQIFYSGHNHFLYIRAAHNLASVRSILRRESAALDPNTGLFESLSLAEYTQAGLFAERIAASLLSALGILSLLLAAVGLYSVMAYAVGERTHEMGIRIALGARRLEVLGMVMGQGMWLTLAGLLIGAALSVAGARMLSSANGIPVNIQEPAILGVASALLLFIAAVASYLPAYRASRVEPMSALRSE